MRHLRALVAVIAVALLAWALAPLPAAFAASPTIKSSVSGPLAGEKFTVSGSLGASGARPVVLQRLSGSTWRPVAGTSKKTTSRGGFSFAVQPISATTKYRAYAKKARVGKSTRKAVATRALTVTFGGTKQSIRVDTLPGIEDQTPSSAPKLSTSGTRGFVVVTVSPLRPGRVVELLSGGTTIATAKLNSRSQATFARADALTRSWGVRARSFNGGPAALQPDVRPKPWTDAFQDEFTAGSFAKWDHRYPDMWLPGRTCSYISSKQVKGSSAGTIALGTKAGAANVQPRLSTRVAKKPSTKDFKAKCKDRTGKPRVYEASALTSIPFTFSYGVAAARIKFDPKRGQNAAFWLQYIGKSGTEIDVVESGGRTFPETLRSGLHQITPGGKVLTYRGVTRNVPASWYDKFHVISVEWTPTHYIFRMDGKETYRTSRALSGAKHEIVLSNLVANWAIPYNNAQSAQMVVDWVRVWQR